MIMERHESIEYKKRRNMIMQIFESDLSREIKIMLQIIELEKYLNKMRNISLPKNLKKFLIKCESGECKLSYDDLTFRINDILGIIFEMEMGGTISDDYSSPCDNNKIYIPNGWQRTKWIPFGSRANGSIVFIDYDPAENGNIGQVCFNDSEGNYEVFEDSLEEFLSKCHIHFNPFIN